ncbi:MAG: ABC transporter permease, partial [Odoribacteraceae bacterium]|nr:ABC transporter permease [Odoribacteraceae bacterium]
GERTAIAVTLEEGADAARVADRIKAKGGYAVKSMEEIAPQVFDWLKLLDLNVWIILALLVSVAGFNMISGLLVLILDKTAMIGTLKALGCGDGSLQMIFLHVATGLVGRGMLWGNALALALAGVQRCFHVVTLDAESYYMSTVPVAINAWHVVLLNAGVMAVTIAILVVPTIIVSRVNPVRSMKFE